MTGSAREELFRVELLLNKGKYKNALELMELFATREGLSADDRIACSLYDSLIITTN
ncbi:MAG: hypothetical protein ACFFCW_33445 [Candidatus Hodarchaeota archaeon]